MEKLSPVEAYVPVSVLTELPKDKRNAQFVLYGEKKTAGTLHSIWFEKWNTTHWLKKVPDHYLFSKEEIERLIGDAFDAGKNRAKIEIEDETCGHSLLSYANTKEEHLKSLGL